MPLRRHVVVACVFLSLTATAPAAEAHNTSWYWSEDSAESELVEYYDGVYKAFCYGKRKWIRLRSGQRGYKHFDCKAFLDDGTKEWGVFHVRGKYRFTFVWDD
jgi:hypothetical protein